MMNTKLLKNLKRAVVKFEENLLNQEVIFTYPILSIQLISILAGYKSRILKINFNTYIDVGRLEEVILRLVRDNDLFRSSIVAIGGKLIVQEHEAPEEIHLPMIDFSYTEDEAREKIINRLLKSKPVKTLGTKPFFIKFLAFRNLFVVLRHLYPRKKLYRILNTILSFPLFNDHNPSRKHALCKFILVKNNNKEYTLMMYLDHLLLDDISIGHITETIEKSYYNDIDTTHKPLKYSCLAAQLGMGSQITNPDIIIDKLRLKDYFFASQQINKLSGYSYHYIFTYNAFIKEIYHSKLIEVAILISAVICSKIFQLSKVPMTLLSGNRKYQAVNYYDTIGLFQDFVPLLIDLEGIDGLLKKNHINDYLNFLSTNNIHVMHTIFNNYNDQNWKEFIALVNPEKIIGSKPVITLNIEFDYTDKDNISKKLTSENNQIAIFKTKDKYLINNLKRKGGIILWVNLSKNSISFKIESLFPIEERNFNKFIEEIKEFVA